jgi:hypothetical protein
MAQGGEAPVGASREFALFLGAGFSKWAAGLPTGSHVFDFSIRADGERDLMRLEVAQRAKREWDAERGNANRGPEEFVADIIAASSTRVKRAVLWYITRRVSDPFVYAPQSGRGFRRQTYMIDENWRFRVPGIVRATDFLKPLIAGGCIGIVTTNYDMLVEYALGSSGFNYGLKGEPLRGRGPYPVYVFNRGPVSLTGPVRLAKLHGSVSWDSRYRYSDGRGGLTGKCLIVAPSPEKTPPIELESTWKLARDILVAAKQVVFFGFGFNRYDTATLSLIQDSTSGVNRVLLVHPNCSVPLSLPSHLRDLTELMAPVGGPDGILDTRVAISEWLSQSAVEAPAPSKFRWQKLDG